MYIVAKTATKNFKVSIAKLAIKGLDNGTVF